MAPSQIITGTLLILGLVALAGFYAYRQLRLLWRLRQRVDLPSEEDDFYRKQARRRLINSGLMVMMAGLMVALMATLEGPAQELANRREQFTQEDAPPLTEQEKSLMRAYGGVVIALLVVLFVILFVAGLDVVATRRYARRQYRKLESDRRAMIERQVARLRSQRNGH